MILDKISNIKKYNLDLQFITQHLETQGFKAGKFETDTPGTFGIGLEYETQDADKGLWEAHRKFLDIHVVMEGEELIQIADITNMREESEYSEENDYQLFTGEKEQTICLKKNYFLVLFPNEVHKGAIKVQMEKKLRKHVYKQLLP